MIRVGRCFLNLFIPYPFVCRADAPVRAAA